MKRNKLFYIGLLSSALLLNPGCSDYLDINTNPNFQAEAEPVSLLPAALVSSAAGLGGDLELYGSFWSQHYTQGHSSNQYNTLVNYTITNTTGQYYWRFIYAGALPDLQTILKKAADEGSWHYWSMAKIMMGFDFWVLSDLYGQIPYTEAIRSEEIMAPKYDDTKTVVYPGIQKMLDEAIAKIEDIQKNKPTLSAIGNEDFLYQGDLESWLRFAKSLKLKMYMRDFTDNKAAIQTLLEENRLMENDAKLDIFVDIDSKSNPLYENDRRKLNSTLNIRACNTLVNYLKTFQDPRAAYFFNSAKGGVIKGLEYGERPSTKTVPQNTISLAKLAPDDPVYFMSTAEVNFIKAEAYALLGLKDKAKESYDAAVSAAFERWGLDGSSFLEADGAYHFDDSSLESMKQCILTQKWIAATRCQAWDAWFDICRTGIPALGTKYTNEAGYVVGQLTPCKTSVLSVGEFPHHLVYPRVSTDYNTSAPEPVAITEKLWWQK